jgi:hypothetical protein
MLITRRDVTISRLALSDLRLISRCVIDFTNDALRAC